MDLQTNQWIRVEIPPRLLNILCFIKRSIQVHVNKWPRVADPQHGVLILTRSPCSMLSRNWWKKQVSNPTASPYKIYTYQCLHMISQITIAVSETDTCCTWWIEERLFPACPNKASYWRNSLDVITAATYITQSAHRSLLCMILLILRQRTTPLLRSTRTQRAIKDCHQDCWLRLAHV